MAMIPNECLEIGKIFRPDVEAAAIANLATLILRLYLPPHPLTRTGIRNLGRLQNSHLARVIVSWTTSVSLPMTRATSVPQWNFPAASSAIWRATALA